MTNLELLQQMEQQQALQAPPQEAPPPEPTEVQPEEPERGIISDTLIGVLGGARGTAQSAIDLATDIGQAVGIVDEETRVELPEVPEPQRLPGRILKPLTQFGLAFIPAYRILQGLRLGATATSALSGAAADFVAFDEAEERLSNVLTEFDNPILNNAVTEYLAADPDDHWAEGRFKNVLEGAGLGVAADVLYRGVRLIKYGKDNPEVVAKEAPELEQAVDRLNDPEAVPTQRVEIDRQETVSRAREALGDRTPFTPEDLRVLHARVSRARAGELPWRDVLKDMPLPSLVNISSDQAKVMVDQIARAIRKSAGEETLWDAPQTVAAVRDLAAEMSMEPEQWLKNLEKLGESRDEVAAWMMAGVGWVNRLADEVVLTSRRFDAGLASKEELDLVLDAAVAATKALREAGSALGRGLNILKYNADAPDPTAEAVQSLLKDLAANGNREEFLRRLKNVQDPGAVTKILHAVTKSRAWNVVNEVWINALLSGPKTHMVNMTSNAIHSIMRPLEEGIGGLLIGDMRAVRRMASTYMGLFQFSMDALRYAKVAWQRGDNVLDPHMSPVGELPHAIGGLTGAVVRTPTRALMAEDEFFKQINYRARVKAKALEEGLEKGLRGAALRKHVEDTFDAAFDDTGRALDAEALRYAEEVTFTNPLEGGLGQSVQRLVEQHPAMRQAIPFVRTPTNLFRQAFRHIPALGMLQRDARRIWTSGTDAERATLVGQQVIGMAILTAAHGLAVQGRLTGGAPGDPALAQAFYQEKQPYSIKVGDSWYSFDRLDPFGMVLGLVADLYQASGELDPRITQEIADASLLSIMFDNLKTTGEAFLDDPTATIGRGISAVSKNAVSKTYLQSIAEILEVLNSDEEWKWKRFLDNRIGSFVPNIARQVNPDPYLREVRNAMDAIMSRIPGLSDKVEPRFDFMGNPVMRTGHPVVRALSPVGHFVEPNHPVWTELQRLGQGLLPAPEKIGNVDLTKFKDERGKTAYYRLNELIAKTKLEERLTALVQSPGYQALTDNVEIEMLHDSIRYPGSKIGAIQKLVDNHRQLAKALLQQERFVSKDGQSLAEALLHDRLNRGLSRVPGTSPLPIQ